MQHECKYGGGQTRRPSERGSRDGGKLTTRTSAPGRGCALQKATAAALHPERDDSEWRQQWDQNHGHMLWMGDLQARCSCIYMYRATETALHLFRLHRACVGDTATALLPSLLLLLDWYCQRNTNHSLRYNGGVLGLFHSTWPQSALHAILRGVL